MHERCLYFSAAYTCHILLTQVKLGQILRRQNKFGKLLIPREPRAKDSVAWPREVQPIARVQARLVRVAQARVDKKGFATTVSLAPGQLAQLCIRISSALSETGLLCPAS